MDVKLKLSFLWHMHQPDYADASGMQRMPWVFLHAIKDYYDMPWMLSHYPNLQATFNLTPTLIRQLKRYEAYGYEKDTFLQQWIQRTETLDEKTKNALIKVCRSAPYDTMVKPLARYAALYKKSNYSAEEMRDLEVLFILAWCGNYLRENEPVVGQMLAKGEGYTEEEKQILMDTLIAFIPKILPFYGMQLQNGRISLSTTPYNHPILPLLIDMHTAAVANPETVLPREPLSLAEDAEKQIEAAVALFQETFGEKPTGFWPAEGAVDTESVHLYSKHGIRWIATDEMLLFKTLGTSDRSLLYRPYRYDDVTVLFRDHPLSDSIGFRYRYLSAVEAVDDFMVQLMQIGKRVPEATVSVILDGENAWEFYPQNGMAFFRGLYERIDNDPSVEMLHFDALLATKSTALETLHPGSWIGGTFDTWVGADEKNRAWELLYQTKRETAETYAKLSSEKKKEVDVHFLAGECSDWFWWYGDDHFSDFLLEFDTLFRSHLMAVYKLCGLSVPPNLYMNIFKQRSASEGRLRPQFPISVEVDGKESSFYEWLGAGKVDDGRLFSTMDGVKRSIRVLYYGENETTLFFRLDTDVKHFLETCKEIRLHFKETDTPVVLPVSAHYDNEGMQLACADFVEFSVDKRYCRQKKKLHLQLELVEADGTTEFVPLFGEIEVCLDDYSKNWFV